MSFRFATCDKNRALEFMKKLYPSQEVTEEKISKLMALVGKDILRIQDPDFHKPAQVEAGTNYSDKYKSEVDEAIKQLKENVHDKEE